LEYKGLMYKKDMLLFLEINSAAGGCLFGEIYKMLTNETRVPYFIIKPMLTIGFDEHFCAYEIKNNSNSKLIGCYMYELPDTTPTIVRVLGNGDTVPWLW